MTVRDDGIGNGSPWVNVKISGGAIKPFRSQLDEVVHEAVSTFELRVYIVRYDQS